MDFSLIGPAEKNDILLSQLFVKKHSFVILGKIINPNLC